MATKTDFKKELAAYRAKHGVIEFVDVPDLQYLMIDGQGDPNSSPALGDAFAAIFPVAYGLKFMSKKELGRDYVVMPPEGLWWAEDMTAFSTRREPAEWRWTVLSMVPDWIGEDLVAAAIKHAGEGESPPARIGDVRLESLSEGRCVQTLHLGSFESEGEVIRRMHAFVADHGLALTGKHHEIYLSDLRRTAPEKLRTILRQPVTTPDAPRG